MTTQLSPGGQYSRNRWSASAGMGGQDRPEYTSVWEYKLGNRSAIEWILDQYKEKKPTDPTIKEKFSSYSFADYKDRVIELLKRVCSVSVETMRIIKEMEEVKNPD